MIVFASIVKWITDPKNRTIILFVFIAFLIGLFFYQRSRTQKFKFEYQEQVKETTRIVNNYEAANDTIVQITNKNGILIAEKAGFELTTKEIETKYDSLFSLYEVEKNKTPEVIVEIRWKYKDSIIEVPTYIKGDTSIVFSDTATYDKDNWRIISGVIPFKYADSKLATLPATVNLGIGMTLGTEVYKDKKTGEVRIKVKTPFKGITFQDIRGAEIMTSIKKNKKVARSFRKEWGVGFNLGLGAMPVAVNNTFQVKFGPVISVGINYTPRFLQFGASQKGKNTISDFLE